MRRSRYCGYKGYGGFTIYHFMWISKRDLWIAMKAWLAMCDANKWSDGTGRPQGGCVWCNSYISAYNHLMLEKYHEEM